MPAPGAARTPATDNLRPMTVAFFSGRGRRAGVALGAVSAGLLVLAACDKPTPLATVTVGDDSWNSGANCYNDGNAIAQKDLLNCVKRKAENTVKVNSTDEVHLGVEPSIADHSWAVIVDGTPVFDEPTKKTYRTMTAAAFFAPDPQTGQPAPKTRQVSFLKIDGKSFSGVWNFTFEKTS